MILDTLTLRNIGTFRHEAVFNFTPTEGRPVVLIGGRNGAGKTTILEAIQWLLYGSLVRTPRRDAGRKKYADYLRDFRHRDAEPRADGSGQLSFRIRRDARDVEIIVRRTIRPNNSRPEKLNIWVDGEPLSRPEDEWPPLVDSILPQQLGPLHLFDGEQIEQLADPEASRTFLRSGIHALLGIDLIEQLGVDLGSLRRREVEVATASTANDQEITEIRSLEASLHALEDRIRDIATSPGELSDARNELHRAESVLRDAEAQFQRKGKTLYERVDEIKDGLAQLVGEREEHRERLRVLSDDCLPLGLVGRVLDDLHNAVAQSHVSATAQERQSVIAETLDALIHWLDKQPDVPTDTVDAVRRYKDDHRVDAAVSVTQELTMMLSEDSSIRLAELRSSSMQEAADETQSLTERIHAIGKEITRLKRAKAAIPDEETLVRLKADYDDAEKRVAEAKSRVAGLESEQRALEHRRQRTQDELDKKLQSREMDLHHEEEHERIVGSCKSAVPLLQEFRRGIVKRHVMSIRNAIWDRFRAVVQKGSLGSSIAIDAESYELSLLDQSETRIPPERLSAGERQLLATAMLWGLADVSYRRLPVVIDTPLGRLDSEHRRNLVESYFPKVAHQVVLLSTDEEIDDRWLKILEPHLARAYTIEFDDNLGCSQPRSGYFKQEVAGVA